MQFSSMELRLLSELRWTWLIYINPPEGLYRQGNGKSQQAFGAIGLPFVLIALASPSDRLLNAD
jgi:hypothetical protein